MKKLLRAVMLCSTAVGSIVLANSSEFRSPLRVVRGVMHWPLDRVDEAWWYDVMSPDCEEHQKWCMETWGAGYRRVAHAAFDPCEDGSTSKTKSLSSLWFGKDSFRGEEIFANGIVSDPDLLMCTNPFLGFARITPRFDYNEHGVVAGLHFRHTFGEDDCWHAGFRVSLPVKEIEIEHDSSCKLEETFSDMFKIKNINNDSDQNANQVDYAIRLDLLSALSRTAGQATVPIVSYGNGTNVPVTRIGGVDVSATTAAGSVDGQNVFPAAYLIRASALPASTSAACCDCPSPFSNVLESGQIPAYPFRKQASQVSGALAADGSGGADGSVLFFQNGQNYETGLATDRDAQGELFVVPRRDVANNEILTVGATLLNNVDNILQLASFDDAPASEFFRSKGIDLCAHDRVVGVGDLDTEFAIGYGRDNDWFADFLLGARFPTGTDTTSARNLYHKPTGNNRHFEIKIGLEGGWQPCDWIAFRLDAAYNHAFKRSECRAQPFRQSTSAECPTACDTNNDCNTSCNSSCKGLFVKNIGNDIEVDVSWDYFVGHAEATLFHPYNPELGCVFGYQLMAKGEDNIDSDCGCDSATGATTATATDLLGRTNQPLDFAVLEQNTNSMTHKLYGDIFHRWHYFELFAGASHIVGGRHAMQETEAHVGMKVFF